jgi:hypothetical protein
VIFRNLCLLDRRGDLDVVLVGPGGIWVVEVKAYRAPVREQGAEWQRRTRIGWVALRERPGQQAQRNAVRLRDFLQRDGIDVRWVECAVALGRPQSVENFRAAAPPVWHLPRLAEDLGPVLGPARLAEAEQARIVAALPREAARQLAREAAQ